MSQTEITEITAEPGKQEIVLRHTFDAPRELVFATATDPDLLPDWWGPDRLSTTVDVMDLRPGGYWRLVHHDTDGNGFAFHGVHHDITAPERVVRTFEFEGAPGHVSLETAVFEDVDGKTRLTTTSVYQSVEDRDAVLASGMEGGARQTMERLDVLVRKART
ncbi:MAG TPA: SRPBCC family protein [Amycolatopsis sp.]|uniref:SRPBCC family protein n=1 Tax=Amycolatopsis sp. TaxID=37632 RepID=UPI002B470F96|nr:SRPBCC family protein [Amycolatopsis sp.]HKS46528.1 SRPBCC family protein [Amycolatopsis sp.]